MPDTLNGHVVHFNQDARFSAPRELPQTFRLDPNVETLPSGAVNPITDTRMDQIPPKALLQIGRTFAHGMKYEAGRPGNWRGVPPEEHLNHARRHLVLWQAGDATEDHVGHVLARMMMWGELLL